jgi:peptide/nickel transport system permease protein
MSDSSVAVPRSSLRGHTWSMARQLPALSCAILAVAIVCAVCAPWISPFDPTSIDLLHRFTPPCWLQGGRMDHLLGTDDLGRDVLSRMIWGARISIFVAVSCVM